MATTLHKPQAAPPAPPQETAPPPGQQPLEPLLVQCASCGSPIAFDQTYCLECGAKNERRRGWLGRFKTRRYVLGGLAVLLAIGGIVGYAAAAASRHDAVKVASKSVPPPAPAATAQAAPTPAPPPTGAQPPATPTVPPSQPASPAPPASHPSTPAPSTSTTPSTPSNSNSGGNSNHHAQPAPAPSHTTTPAYAKLFGSGRSPIGAGPFDPNNQGGVNANSLSKVFDDDAGTVWKSGTYASGVGAGVGFYVDDGAPGTIKGLGLLAKTPGFDVQVYGYNSDTPPAALADWTQLGSKTNAGERNNIKLDLAGQQYQLYLVWFTKLPANSQRFEIPEVQLLP
jgi:hypothetical protein